MSLFEEFSPPTRDEWTRLVEEELDGESIEKKLSWKTYEGMTIPPLFFADDGGAVRHANFLPGFPPFVGSSEALGFAARPWRVVQLIDAPTPADAHTHALAGIAGGAAELELRVSTSGSRGIALRTITDAKSLLEGLPLDHLTIRIVSDRYPMVFLALVAEAARALNADARALRLIAAVDPLAMLLRRGALPVSLDALYGMLAAARRGIAPGASITTCGVDASLYQNAGGSAVHDVAFSVAAGVESLRRLVRAGLTIDEAAASMRFTFAVGANFFFEIAKLRAARMLWAKAVHHFGPSDDSITAMQVHAVTSRWSHTEYDPHVNILRGTVETMAAVLGGAQSVAVHSFDGSVGDPASMPQRLARNTSHILREESHLHTVVDPSSGSYYIEHLTDALARDAWALFQDVERRGGFAAAAAEGFVQDHITRTRAERDARIAARKDVFVGTTQYPNLAERHLAPQPSGESAVKIPVKQLDAATRALLNQAALDGHPDLFSHVAAAFAAGADLEAVADAVHVHAPETALTVVPLNEYRGASVFEDIRAAVDGSSRRPKVFLAPLGPAFWRRARATFAAGFFGVAGFEIVDSGGFPDPETAVSAAVSADADIVVACSDDESYPEIVPLLADVKSRRPGTLLVVAGYPKDAVEPLKAAGVDAFIHVRANAVETLAAILSRLDATGAQGARA